MALSSSAAQTDESTPPERAHKTRASPICSLSCSTDSAMNEDGRQSPVHPQTFTRKFRSTVCPRGVCMTSGWNCTPYILRFGSAMAAQVECSVRASTEKPGGTWVTRSPWLIHTCISEPQSSSNVPGAITVAV